jgi:hypothetical protein
MIREINTRLSYLYKNKEQQREKKMSQVIDLCEDSDDDNNGERPSTASVPSLPVSGKRPRDKGESSYDGHAHVHTRNKNEPGGERGVGSKYVEEVEHRESHEAEMHPMNSDLDQISQDNGSTNEHSQKRSTSKHPSNAYRRLWEDRLSQLADYRKVHGHCNVPQSCSENPKLGKWVGTQRNRYRLYQEGKTSPMTASRIKELESLDFEWDSHSAAWGDRLNELADYREIHGHCNVPNKYSKNTKLGIWVGTQRSQYKLYVEGKRSYLMLSRIQELESLGFEWGSCCITAWGDRLSELADYRKIYGHCNVPNKHSENSKLGRWVGTQRFHYRLHVEGKRSQMTLSRIQELESLGFEWKRRISRGKGAPPPKKPSVGEDTLSDREGSVEAQEHMQQRNFKKTLVGEKSAAIKPPKTKNPTERAKSTLPLSQVKPQLTKRMEARDVLFDKRDLDGSPSELAAMSSLYRDRQDAKSLSLGKSAPDGDSVKSNARDDAPRSTLPWPARQQKGINLFSHTLLNAGSPENGVLVAAKMPVNSKQDTESQLETAPSKIMSMLRSNPVAAEPQQRGHNPITHALLLAYEPIGNSVPATPDKLANAPSDMPQTPSDEFFQSDNVLNEVELELNWLGEESMYCLSRPEFQFDFIYEYASPALKVELRKLSRDDQGETDKLKQIVRMSDWLVSQRFDFVRDYIRKVLCRGFRRERMRTVIAELRLLRRQQSKRHFPAMILDRDDTAPVKTSTIIEQVDANTLEVVSTFSSQSEAERQTGIPRTHIRRGLRQGRPLGGYFWRSVRL